MGLLNNDSKLVEPMIYEGTADRYVIQAYFETVLPKLEPKSVIILDNASFHKSKKLVDLFKEYDCILLFLPPYSPDLNPIENMWGTIKQKLRNFYDYTKDLFENLCIIVNQYLAST